MRNKSLMSSWFPSLVCLFLLWSGPALSHENEEASLYDLTPVLTDQDGKKVGIDVYKGHPVIVSMFYASCPYTCPVLIDAVKKLDAGLKPEEREKVRILLVSLDPANDTPEALKKAAKERGLDLKRAKMVTTPESSVREIAAVLDIKYRQVEGGDFNHTPMIGLVDKDGHVVFNEEGVVATEGMLKKLKDLAK